MKIFEIEVLISHIKEKSLITVHIPGNGLIMTSSLGEKKHIWRCAELNQTKQFFQESRQL